MLECLLLDTITYLALTMPESITCLMPLMVIDVSAIFVATTTFRQFCNENIQTVSSLFPLKLPYHPPTSQYFIVLIMSSTIYICCIQ